MTTETPQRLREYLSLHQNNPAGSEIPARAGHALQVECERVWGLMQMQPDSYTPSDLEAAIFNAFADGSRKGNRNAQMAVARHWNARGLN